MLFILRKKLKLFLQRGSFSSSKGISFRSHTTTPHPQGGEGISCQSAPRAQKEGGFVPSGTQVRRHETPGMVLGGGFVPPGTHHIYGLDAQVGGYAPNLRSITSITPIYLSEAFSSDLIKLLDSRSQARRSQISDAKALRSKISDAKAFRSRISASYLRC